MIVIYNLGVEVSFIRVKSKRQQAVIKYRREQSDNKRRLCHLMMAAANN